MNFFFFFFFLMLTVDQTNTGVTNFEKFFHFQHLAKTHPCQTCKSRFQWENRKKKKKKSASNDLSFSVFSLHPRGNRLGVVFLHHHVRLENRWQYGELESTSWDPLTNFIPPPHMPSIACHK